MNASLSFFAQHAYISMLTKKHIYLGPELQSERLDSRLAKSRIGGVRVDPIYFNSMKWRSEFGWLVGSLLRNGMDGAVT
jgi:hypothetical protein